MDLCFFKCSPTLWFIFSVGSWWRRVLLAQSLRREILCLHTGNPNRLRNWSAKWVQVHIPLFINLEEKVANTNSVMQGQVVVIVWLHLSYFCSVCSLIDYPDWRVSLSCHAQEERDKTTGAGWFNMRAPEMTEEIKGDLKALKMRGAMDPKRFYKKNDRDGFPKYFQVSKHLTLNCARFSQWSMLFR